MNRRTLLQTLAGAAAALRPAQAPAAAAPAPLKKSADEWRKLLPADRYGVLFEEDTERAGSSPLNKEKGDGTFVCAACFLPLFDAKMKYESGTGWPSFFDVLPGAVGKKTDFKIVFPRTEYHCARCGGHQGHVFDDGPKPTGLRYCNNGLALLFVPRAQPLPELRTLKRLALALLAATLAISGPGARAGDAAAQKQHAIATFASGCFWCTESDFEKVDGVISATSGYTGGKIENPTYEQVSGGDTDHAEAVRVVFDPAKVSYETLLDVYWRNVDPTAKDRQFCDVGTQYRSAIFVHDPTQRRLAEASLKKLEASGRLKGPIHTQIESAGAFYPAEDYHQDYYKKNPIRYKFYRTGCGRDRRLQEIWG